MAGEKLAKGITTFSKEEYDYYQKFISSKKEWPGLKIRTDSQVRCNIPMIIMELYRLVPYKEGSYIHFHPLNMPNVKVCKIELTGMIISIKTCNYYMTLIVDDGTGRVQVNYKLNQNKIRLMRHNREKNRIQDENLKSKTKMNESSKKFSENMGTECESNDLDMLVEKDDYIHITGYPWLDTNFQQVPNVITTEFMRNTKMMVYALSIEWISEKMYNDKIAKWISNTIRERYIEVEDYTAKNK
ncbi:uncharacterized protein LOC105194547 isoform X2 [Solenopsis invicta]|uniref:uncharacterized protein LOC105194547 isoform X2 n=1 Tax=Solenopsis invicta TaxID=13686 RepID=UPI000595FBA6|nr:uncharacterized protein LOC105194547 isoform X2 [Solenopsis invicta]